MAETVLETLPSAVPDRTPHPAVVLRARPARRSWLTVGAALIVLAGLACAVYAWSFADRVAFLPPLLGQPIMVRHDLHGQGDFGASRHGRRVHHGVDLIAAVGTPVRAAKGGWVVEARNDKRGMGNYVTIWHGRDLSTLYAHLSRMDVRVGQHVRQGQTIGAVGKTGNARARDITAHLHFEVHQDGDPVDPMDGYLRSASTP